jgi:hypothetical protein
VSLTPDKTYANSRPAGEWNDKKELFEDIHGIVANSPSRNNSQKANEVPRYYNWIYPEEFCTSRAISEKSMHTK